MTMMDRRCVLVALALVGLTGCEDKEAQQRKAFIEFLQTRILDQPGTRAPQLTDAQIERFGDYTKQYVIISDFHKTMDNSVSGQLRDAVARGARQICWGTGHNAGTILQKRVTRSIECRRHTTPTLHRRYGAQ
jgi:hypothetical protein